MVSKNRTTIRPLDWLLEPEDIGVKYLAMRDLLKAGEKEILAVKKLAHTEGPIAQILLKMKDNGYWEQPSPGVYVLYLVAQGRDAAKTDQEATEILRRVYGQKAEITIVPEESPCPGRLR